MMFPAPELIGAEQDYRRERAVPVRRKRRGRSLLHLRRSAARRVGPTPHTGRPAVSA